jgi:phytoene dehydrogenase-like protein
VQSTDIIIIGGGPNGLTAGAYLAKTGLQVLVLDCNQELGGGLATEMVTYPGFLTNTHAIYHMMVEYAPIFQDFQLEDQYGIRFAFPELQFTMLFADSSSLCLYRDVERTCQSIAAFSQKDADSYRVLHAKLEAFMENYLGPLTYVPAMGALEQIPMLARTELGQEFLEMSELSAQQLIDGYFEDDRVRALFYYASCHWGLEYDSTGLGFMIMLNMNRITNYRLCVGGSHRLASALQKIVLENKGRLMGSQRVAKILVNDGVACGVELEDGTQIEARKGVISTIDLATTFSSYVGENNLDPAFVESIKTWQWEKWSLLQLHYALKEPPRFTAAEKNPDINRSLIYLIGYEGTQDVIRHWEGIARGEQQKEGFICSFPSVHDPSQAPAGMATGLISQIAPYELAEGASTWERHKFKEQLMAERLAVLQKYAPNMTPDMVIGKYAVTPLGTERRFPDMVRGSIKQGNYNVLQLGFNRPNADCSLHRTPIKNLWLGGANSYPGGMAIFGAGYLTADAVVEDIGVEKWWSEPESVRVAKERGMIEIEE